MKIKRFKIDESRKQRERERERETLKIIAKKKYQTNKSIKILYWRETIKVNNGKLRRIKKKREIFE